VNPSIDLAEPGELSDATCGSLASSLRWCTRRDRCRTDRQRSARALPWSTASLLDTRTTIPKIASSSTRECLRFWRSASSMIDRSPRAAADLCPAVERRARRLATLSDEIAHQAPRSAGSTHPLHVRSADEAALGVGEGSPRLTPRRPEGWAAEQRCRSKELAIFELPGTTTAEAVSLCDP
jgi:hypothetical protein